MDITNYNITLVIFCVICAITIYLIAYLMTNMRLISKDVALKDDIIASLRSENIEYLRKIQDLTNQVEYLEKTGNEYEKARKEAFESAKASLFDLGGMLSKQLIEIHKKETSDSRELQEKNITVATEKFHTEFERLVGMVTSLSKDVDQSRSTVDVIRRSLLSPSGAGKLAEITLENLLKSSGLRATVDFRMQHTLVGASSEKLRPDAVIFLPSNNLMIIDAKASKFLCEIEGSIDESELVAISSGLMKTMNAHLKSLISKEYAENTALHYHLQSKHFSNIITLMFLPTESSLERIADIDQEFIHKAWANNIFPVGPAGLMNMLSFAKFQINDYLRTENHKIIFEEVKKLINASALLAEHYQKIGSNIQTLTNNYDKFSGSFNRNFLSKVRHIQSLGVDIGKDSIKPISISTKAKDEILNEN